MSSQAFIFNPREDRLAAAGVGFQHPRLTTGQRLALTVGPGDAGMTVFDITLLALMTWNGTAWEGDSGFVSITDFGGVGDDATDCTSALNAAIATGKPVLIPDGIFRIDGTTVNVPSNTRIFGFGRTSVLRRTVKTSPMMSTSSAGTTNVWFRDLRLQGPAADYTDVNSSALRLAVGSSTGVEMTRCFLDRWCHAVDVRKGNPELDLHDCPAEKNSGSLVRSEAAVRHQVCNCVVDGDRTGVGDGTRGRVGIWLSDPGDGSDSGYDNLVSGNIVRNTFNESIIVRTAYTVVSNNECSLASNGASGTYGIVVEPTSGVAFIGEFGFGAGNYVTVTANQVRQCDAGIRVSLDPANINGTPRDAIVSDNLVEGCNGLASKGIAIGFSSAANSPLRCLVSGNRLRNPTATGNADGIYLFSVKSAIVTGNLIDSAVRYGIVLDTLASGGAGQVVGVSVCNNVITNGLANSTGIFLYPRVAQSIQRCSVVGNTISWATAINGSGIVVDTLVNGIEECSFVANTVLGSTTNTGYGLRLNGSNLVSVGNVARCINNRSIESNGTLTWLTNGAINDLNGRKVAFGTAAPASAATSFNIGDICWNTAPAPGGYAGWLCTAAGSPGTWAPFGLIV